jgi:hypothetical protein
MNAAFNEEDGFTEAHDDDGNMDCVRATDAII